jgi:hypothetical protein
MHESLCSKLISDIVKAWMWSILVPGRNNIVACDSGGRAFGIEIQEGNGDIRNYLIDLGTLS